MTTQNKATIAPWVAGATAMYLVLGLTDIGLGSENLSVLFLPAIYMMILPAPLLAVFGLADRHSLLLEPNTAGVIVLIALYAGLAYVVTRFIENLLSRPPPHE
jgi:hypothetical protein